MTCMCGDLYCWSCGPAQGNAHCEVCGRWSLDDPPCECSEERLREYEEYLVALWNAVQHCGFCLKPVMTVEALPSKHLSALGARRDTGYAHIECYQAARDRAVQSTIAAVHAAAKAGRRAE